MRWTDGKRWEWMVSRMKRMGYRPGPVRRVLIPKEGKPGATRPLGIGNFEDKLVQGVMRQVLESIYEPVFLDCSYGFRPGRGCHNAIRALHKHLYCNEVEAVIDVDLAGFFDSIDHTLLLRMLAAKIADPRCLRYLARMFEAGVLAESELQVSDEGVPQGSLCSPILANIFAHYVIDKWFEETVTVHCEGRVEVFRYADDLVVCCRYEGDAVRIRRALGKRLAKYKLHLNEEKTQLVTFSRRKRQLGEKQGAFDFLGFTFYWGKSRRGAWVPKVKTSGKRLRTKLKRVSQWARDVRHRGRLPWIWATFCRKLRGHIQYYGVSFNIAAVRAFVFHAMRILHRWLNRRSQRRSFSWERFYLYVKANPPPSARIYHTLF